MKTLLPVEVEVKTEFGWEIPLYYLAHSSCEIIAELLCSCLAMVRRLLLWESGSAGCWPRLDCFEMMHATEETDSGMRFGIVLDGLAQSYSAVNGGGPKKKNLGLLT